MKKKKDVHHLTIQPNTSGDYDFVLTGPLHFSLPFVKTYTPQGLVYTSTLVYKDHSFTISLKDDLVGLGLLAKNTILSSILVYDIPVNTVPGLALELAASLTLRSVIRGDHVLSILEELFKNYKTTLTHLKGAKSSDGTVDTFIETLNNSLQHIDILTQPIVLTIIIPILFTLNELHKIPTETYLEIVEVLSEIGKDYTDIRNDIQSTLLKICPPELRNSRFFLDEKGNC